MDEHQLAHVGTWILVLPTAPPVIDSGDLIAGPVQAMANAGYPLQQPHMVGGDLAGTPLNGAEDNIFVRIINTSDLDSVVGRDRFYRERALKSLEELADNLA